MEQSDTIQLFRQCGTCSRTFSRLLDREFGHIMEEEERAMDPMAGGIMNQGHQCGMLWGSALAAGAEAYRRHPDKDEAMAVAITAVQHIIDSFEERTGTVNCREIIGLDISKVSGMIRFMIRTTLQGINNNPCFQLAEDWAPEVVGAAHEGLSESVPELNKPVLSCAAETVRKMGGTEEEQVMVSGFAGGLGLSGSGCGALAAAVWMKTLAWCRDHPGKTPPYFNNVLAKETLKAFRKETGGKMRCDVICGEKFISVKDHTDFIASGNCAALIDVLSKS